MIVLTMDIHHMSLNTGNQQHSDRSEISIAADFVAMLEEKRVKSTAFITGKSFEEEWADLAPLCQATLMELGGHTYSCFEPSLWHRGWNKLIGSYNGPRWYQNWDIAKTKKIIERKTGRKINCWRNHMYMHGPFTEELLVKNGINICCDGVKRYGPVVNPHPTGLTNFSINIIPDHEHLYHAERTIEWVEHWVRRYNWSDDYGSESYYIDEWVEIVKREITLRESAGVVSHLIIHPITLYLCNGFEALEEISDFIRAYETCTVSDYVSHHGEATILSAAV